MKEIFPYLNIVHLLSVQYRNKKMFYLMAVYLSKQLTYTIWDGITAKVTTAKGLQMQYIMAI